MTIIQAIKWLRDLEVKHGPEIQVYFDCPKCRESFVPNIIEAAAVHITAKEKQ